MKLKAHIDFRMERYNGDYERAVGGSVQHIPYSGLIIGSTKYVLAKRDDVYIAIDCITDTCIATSTSLREILSHCLEWCMDLDGIKINDSDVEELIAELDSLSK
jgi:hypothetical protein